MAGKVIGIHEVVKHNGALQPATMIKNKLLILHDRTAEQWRRFCAGDEVEPGIVRNLILELRRRSRG